MHIFKTPVASWPRYPVAPWSGAPRAMHMPPDLPWLGGRHAPVSGIANVIRYLQEGEPLSKKKNGSAHRDWKGDLQRLIDRHNGRHAVRGKTVSHSTQSARASGLFRIFKLLRSAGFKIGPSSLGGRHIEFLMGYWTADLNIEPALRLRASTLELPEAPLSAAYIQQQLSFLRALSDWIEKPGLVRPAQSYGCDPALVTRASNATRDRTWSAAKTS